MRKKYLCITIILSAFSLWPSLAHSQYVVDYKRQGDQYFSQKNYYAASIYYQKALLLVPDTSGRTYYFPYSHSNGYYGKRQQKNAEQYQYLVYQLGESFRLYKDYKDAEPWYEKVTMFKNNKFPLARLWYAVCLRADGKYEQAIKQLEQFQSSYSEKDQYSLRAKIEMESCKYAKDQMKYPRVAFVEKLPPPVNGQGSNYAPVIAGSEFYFTSSRPVQGINAKKENPFINKIYKTDLTGINSFDTLTMLFPETKGEHTELAAQAFSPAYTRMYLTEWQQPKGKSKGPAHYVIAVSHKDDNGNWTPPVALGNEVNDAGSNSKEPFVPANGQYLLFSSDRTGGQGGYDLWFCPLGIDGMPSGSAVNLGSIVNTPANEVNPYFDSQTNTLTFSSDGRPGMGGFDLYQSEGSLFSGNWTSPVDMGYPVNSAKDDIFYFPSGKDQFYTSSDRNSTCCLGLYAITLKHIAITGTVYDCDSQKPLQGVEVGLRDSISNNVIGRQLTDQQGHYRFEVINRKPLKLKFSKNKYFSKNMVVTSEDMQETDTMFSRELCLKKFEVGKPIIIPNIEYDFNKATLRPGSKLVLDSLALILKDNPNMVVQMSSYTDSIGSVQYNLDLSQRRAQSCVDYLIKDGISPDRMTAKGYGKADPIAHNSLPDGRDNPEGRQKNRRTAFIILKD